MYFSHFNGAFTVLMWELHHNLDYTLHVIGQMLKTNGTFAFVSFQGLPLFCVKYEHEGGKFRLHHVM